MSTFSSLQFSSIEASLTAALSSAAGSSELFEIVELLSSQPTISGVGNRILGSVI